MSNFGKNIKKIRSIKKLSQSAFADIFNLKRASIGAYEEGRSEAKIDTVIEIAKYFSLTIEQLIVKELTVNHITHFDPVKAALKKANNGNNKQEIKLINLVMGDTSDMDWNEDIYEDVDSVIMKMKLANRFPFDGLLQIYFTADNDQGGFTIIDSIFTEQHSINSVPDEKYRGYWKLKGPGVDTYGFSIPEEVDTSKMSVTIDAERIEKPKFSAETNNAYPNKPNTIDGTPASVSTPNLAIFTRRI